MYTISDIIADHNYFLSLLKKIIILCLMTLLILPACAQQDDKAAWKEKIRTAASDTARMRLISELSEMGIGPELESYTQQLLSLSQKGINAKDAAAKNYHLKYYAIALNNLAFVKEGKGLTDTAMSLYQQSYAISEGLNERNDMANALNNIGYIHKKKGNFTAAIDYYEKALVIYREVGNRKSEGQILGNIAIIFQTQGNVVKALDYHRRSLRIKEEIGDKKGQASSFNSLGGIYTQQKETALALEYYQKAYNLAMETKSPAVINILGNIASVYQQLNEDKKAYGYYKQALAIAQEKQIKDAVSLSLHNMGSICNKMGLTDSALHYFNQSLDIRKASKDSMGIANTMAAIGLIYSNKKETGKAIGTYRESLQISQSQGYADITLKTSKALYNLYKEKGDIPGALKMHELYAVMLDSVNNSNTSKEVLKSQFKYEYETKAIADSLKAAESIKLAGAKLRQEKTQRIGLIAIVGLVLLIAFFVFRQMKLQQKLKEASLRNKIASDLHDDVGSTMSTISILSEVAQADLAKEKVQPLLSEIGGHSRQLLDRLDDIVWSVNPKNDSLAQLVPRMKLFANELLGMKNISIVFDTPDDIPPLSMSMESRRNFYLIYKEALHNIFKYAEASQVNIRIHPADKELQLGISDNGKGFDMHTQAKGNGLGNMQVRAEELKGKLSISSTPGQGTTVNLSIPV